MGLDLRDEVQLESLLATADALLARESDLESLECLLASQAEAWPLAAQLAVKLARSKALIADRVDPLHLSVILPLYREHERILRPDQHTLGEGFLDRKLRQLDWLFGTRVDQTFELLIVDDGCPEGSGRIAEDILTRRHADAPARVLYLNEAIEQQIPVVASMQTVEDSRKGGSIHLGLWEAPRVEQRDHVVLYTDADLSTHLGQSGLLIDALDRPGIQIASGSRRAPRSVVVKSEGRSARGRLFIYLWKKLLPELAYLDDTQCGFKAMSADVARSLLERPRERGFAFDLELLLRSELSSPRSIASVPIAWIDSQEASTTTGLSPYLPMLRSAVDLYRTFSDEKPRSESFARAIESLDEESWQRAIEVHGPRLEHIDPALDRDNTPISPIDLLAVAS
jgi:hypothetical protein